MQKKYTHKNRLINRRLSPDVIYNQNKAFELFEKNIVPVIGPTEQFIFRHILHFRFLYTSMFPKKKSKNHIT